MNQYQYDAANANDLRIGVPSSTYFKANLSVIPPSVTYGRTDLQVHPDGSRNGTAGCIGIQGIADTKRVKYLLQNFHGLKVKCKTF